MKLNQIKNSPLSHLVSGIIIGVIVVIAMLWLGGDKEYIDVKEELCVHKVEKVLDGDTLRLDNNETVRLIGVDTPESVHNEIPVQVFSKEASEFTRQLCEGFNVCLEFDEERLDKYGRTLAYVYLEDSRMVNEELIKRGYAYVVRRFPFRRKDEFLALQEIARSEQRGLWSYNLSYGRLAQIADTFDKLSDEGKNAFNRAIDNLLEKYPKEGE